MTKQKPYGIKEIKVQILRETISDEVSDTPEKVAAQVQKLLADHPYYNPEKENFIILHLDTRRRIKSWEIASQGTKDTLLVHPGETFRSAVVANASAIIIVHNHPSGDSSPSEADIRVTRDLIRAGQLLKIEVLDHIILGNKYTSLRELGYFY